MALEKQTLKSVKSIDSLDGITRAMAYVFQDAQLSLSGHRKLVVILKSIYLRAIELNLENSFLLKFVKLINKILPLKKGEQVADRIAKFCSNFVSSLFKDETTRRNEGHREPSDSVEDASYLSEFLDYLVRHLLRGIQAKDKNVRYRVVQLLAYIVNYIGEIDEDLFKALHWSLNRRLNDKEPNVRIQAVVALSSFQYINMDDNPDSEKHAFSSATKSLLHVLQNDESAEVRRAALLNLIKNEETIPFLLERARDVNSINRRLVFSRILKEIHDFRHLNFALKERLLKWGLHDRDEKVLSCVIKMFSNSWLELVGGNIFELVDSLSVVESEIAETAMHLFYKARPDVVSSLEVSEQMWKELTTERAFVIRTFCEYCNENNMYELIEKNFPESIELATILSKYLRLRKSIIDENQKRLEEYSLYKSTLETYDSQLSKLKEDEQVLMSRWTGRDNLRRNEKLSQEMGKLREAFEDALKEREQEIENNKELSENYLYLHEQMRDLEFIIHQLLLISKDYDFSDEIGRRQMLQIIRSSVTDDNLPDELIKTSLKVLSKISINERDFIAMCTEIVTDIRDSYMDENDDDSFHSAISGFQDTPSEDEYLSSSEAPKSHGWDKRRAENSLDEYGSSEGSETPSRRRQKKEPKQAPDNIVVRCLLITQHLLELTEEPLSNNYSLGSLIESLVRPAVLRNEKPNIRLLGMKCLGLFCLLDRNLAVENLFFFGMAAAKADEDLRIECIKIIFDILSTFGISVLDIEGGVDSLSLARLFYKILRIPEMPGLQCVVAEGLCKLFLADILTDFGKSEDLEDDLHDNGGTEKQHETRNDGDQEKQLLETLLLTYFHPLNVRNHDLRQILAFCIPVYAFSHPRHQEKIASVSGDCFFRMFSQNGEASKYEKFTSPNTVIQHLIYWCDPNNLVNISEEEVKKSPSHFWQTITFLQAIEQDTPKNIKRTIINNLAKMQLSEYLGLELLRGLVNGIQDTKNVIDTNTDDPNFVLDASTSKNFERFFQNVLDLVSKAEALEADSYKSDEDDSPLTSSQSIRTIPRESTPNVETLENADGSSTPTTVSHPKSTSTP